MCKWNRANANFNKSAGFLPGTETLFVNTFPAPTQNLAVVFFFDVLDRFFLPFRKTFRREIHTNRLLLQPICHAFF
jgi:hypothetical protein